LIKKSIDFNSLSFKEADVNVVTYKGDSIDNFNRFISKFDDGTPRNPNKPVFKLNSRIVIKDSKISITIKITLEMKENGFKRKM
jgi:hypothetical protein